MDLDQMVSMSTIKGVLKPSKFLFSLEKKNFTSFFEMLICAEKYANAKESFLAKKTLAPGPSEKEKEKERKKDKRKREEPLGNNGSAQVRDSLKSSTLRFHNYTSLNTPRSKILIEI